MTRFMGTASEFGTRDGVDGGAGDAQVVSGIEQDLGAAHAGGEGDDVHSSMVSPAKTG